jgi:uncharacterized protein
VTEGTGLEGTGTADVQPAQPPGGVEPTRAARRSAAPFASEPVMVGLPAIAVGLLVMGITFVNEIVPSSRALGGIVPVVVFGTGLVLLFATIWAATRGEGVLAGIFGAVGGFTLSLAALILGLIHNWYAISSADVAGTEELFFLSWACVFFFLIFPCLRLPPVYPLIAAFFMTFLVLLTAGIFENTGNLLIGGGAAALTVAFLSFYGFVGAGMAAAGLRLPSAGKPLL